MKKIIFLFILIPAFLQAQEVELDSIYYSTITVTDNAGTTLETTHLEYYHEHLVRFDNGNETIEKVFVGDSTTFVGYLFNEEVNRQKMRAKANRIALENETIGPAGGLLKAFTGDRQYVHTAERLGHVFIGDYTVRVDGTAYNAVGVEKVNGNIELQIETLGDYVIYILSRKSFLLKNYNGTGEHLEVFYTATNGNRQIFWDSLGEVKVVKK